MKKHFLTPDYLFETIFDITPAFLCEKQIHGVIVDVDGTAASHHDPLPSEKIHQWVDKLHKAGITVLFLSNNKHERVKTFADPVGALSIGRAFKPFPKGFRKAIDTLKLPRHQIAVIGDQIYTDTLGGNRQDLLTLMVRSMDRAEPFIKLRWVFEWPFALRARRYPGGK